MYRVLIVEDEPAEQKALAQHLLRYGGEKNEQFQVQCLDNANDFVKAKTTYDLVFLDIELPGINGMEAAQLLRVFDQRTPIMFVTNLAKYAIHGYEVGAVDFVVKPVSYPSFALRMDKALAVMRQNAPRTLIAPTHDGKRVLQLSHISFVEVKNHEVIYHLEDQDNVCARSSLSQVESELEGSTFVRISNNCLVNMAMVHSVNAERIVLADGETLHFSRARRKDALRAITEFWGGA